MFPSKWIYSIAQCLGLSKIWARNLIPQPRWVSWLLLLWSNHRHSQLALSFQESEATKCPKHPISCVLAVFAWRIVYAKLLVTGVNIARFFLLPLWWAAGPFLPVLLCSALLHRPYTHRLFIDSGGKWQRLSRSLSWKIKPKDIQVFTCLSVFRCCQGRVVHFASPGLFKVSFFLLAPLLLWSLSAEILCPVKLNFIHLNTNGE